MKALDLVRGAAIVAVAAAMILPSPAGATLVAKTVLSDEFGYQT